MFKRYMLASLVAGLALGAQSALADTLWFYPGHGWLAQPPFDSGRPANMTAVAVGDDSPFPYAATTRQSAPWADFVPDSRRRVTVIAAPAPARGVQVAGKIPAHSVSEESGQGLARFCEPTRNPHPERPLERCPY